MKTIHKYQLTQTSSERTMTVEMPQFHEIVRLDLQNNVITIWAIVDTDTQLYKETFHIFGTGHRIPEHSKFEYVGTIFQFGFVWHIFHEVDL